MLRLIDSLERTGSPPRIEHVKQAAERINIHGRPPGKNWITRFLNRHPEVVARFTTSIDHKRKEATTPQVIKDHFKKIEELLKHVPAQYICNMDKKGFLMGLAARSKVICSYRYGSFPVSDDGNRELLTCIETVSAAGHVLPSCIIYKGTAHYMGWHTFTGSATGTEDFQFSYSPRGWTNRVLSLLG